MSDGEHELVAIGASWGGLEALRRVLRPLPADFAAAIVVVQHRGATGPPGAFRDLLGAATGLRVCEAGDKDALDGGVVYVAPPDYHLLIQGRAFALSTDAAVQYSRPSIDLLLETAAEAYRRRCVGVVLTGSNADGARGLARVAELGGATIVEDPATAERPEMPRAALSAVPEAVVAPLDEIPRLLVALCGAARVPA